MPGRASCACRSQLASLSACQMPLKFGLPSAVRAGRDAWPAVRVTEIEMTALTAADTIATVTIEPLNRRMMTSPSRRMPGRGRADLKVGPYVLSRQRIAVLTGVGKSQRESSTPGGALPSRIGTLLRDEGALLAARARQQRHHPVVALVAPGLLVDPVRLVALLAVVLLDGPRFRPRRGILDGDRVLDRVRVNACPPFDQVQVLLGTLEVGLGAEIGHIDHECPAFPAAARVAPPLADVRRQMRAAGHGDGALPSLPLAGVVEDRHAPGRLHDLQEEAGVATEIRQCGGHAPLTESPILG